MIRLLSKLRTDTNVLKEVYYKNNHPTLMLDERSPCEKSFRTVCRGLIPYSEAVTVPYAFTFAAIAFRSIVWCSK